MAQAITYTSRIRYTFGVLPPSPYEDLGILPTLNQGEIRLGYQRATIKLHRDVASPSDDHRLRIAYAQLSTPMKIHHTVEQLTLRLLKLLEEDRTLFELIAELLKVFRRDVLSATRRAQSSIRVRATNDPEHRDQIIQVVQNDLVGNKAQALSRFYDRLNQMFPRALR